jgi:hypothetical protein
MSLDVDVLFFFRLCYRVIRYKWFFRQIVLFPRTKVCRLNRKPDSDDTGGETNLRYVRNVRTGEIYTARFSRYIEEERALVDLPVLIRYDGVYLDITEHITLKAKT